MELKDLRVGMFLVSNDGDYYHILARDDTDSWRYAFIDRNGDIEHEYFDTCSECEARLDNCRPLSVPELTYLRLQGTKLP